VETLCQACNSECDTASTPDALHPKQGSFSQIKYKYTFQGEVFDKTDDDETLEVIPGSGMTTAGMEEGIISMKVGEVARFVFDPLFSFKENGYPPKVPPHAVVELWMEVVEFIGPFTEETKITAGGEFKEQGNALFKAGEYRPALKKYARGLDIVGRRKRRLPPSLEKFEIGQQKMRLQLLQNTMQCWFKLGNIERSLDFAKQLVNMDPANPKARFRFARNELEHHNYHQAREQLAYLDKVEDEAIKKEVARELREIARVEKLSRDKERVATKAMAKAFGTLSSDPPPASTDAPTAAPAPAEAPLEAAQATSPPRHVDPQVQAAEEAPPTAP